MAEHRKKIDSIIDKLVDGKIEFNTKSFLEQSNTKLDMAKCINSAIGNLNDFGQKLALEELDIKITQGDTKIFDNNGNINTIELTKITSGVVKATIENARKKGIKVTNEIEAQQNGDRNSNDTLTSYKAEKMIQEYGNLSIDEQKMLWDNYSKMSKEEQIMLAEANIKHWKECAKQAKNPDVKKYCEAKVRELEGLLNLKNSENPADKKILFGLIKENKEFKSWCKENGYEDLDFKEYSEAIGDLFIEYSNKIGLEMATHFKQDAKRVKEISNENLEKMKIETSDFEPKDIADYSASISNNAAKIADYINFMKNSQFIQFLEKNNIRLENEFPSLNDEMIELMDKFAWEKQKITDNDVEKGIQLGTIEVVEMTVEEKEALKSDEPEVEDSKSSIGKEDAVTEIIEEQEEIIIGETQDFAMFFDLLEACEIDDSDLIEVATPLIDEIASSVEKKSIDSGVQNQSKQKKKENNVLEM